MKTQTMMMARVQLFAENLDALSCNHLGLLKDDKIKARIFKVRCVYIVQNACAHLVLLHISEVYYLTMTILFKKSEKF